MNIIRNNLIKVFDLRAWMVFGCLISGCFCQAYAFDPTTEILTQNFDAQAMGVQRKILRNLGVLQPPSAASFLMQVALSPLRFHVEVRREALKNLLALDGQYYRPVLLLLQGSQINEKELVQTLQQIGSFTHYVDAWTRAVDFADAKWMLEAKMQYLYIALTRNGGKLKGAWLQDWDVDKAKAYLQSKVKAEKKNQAWSEMLTLLEGG